MASKANTVVVDPHEFDFKTNSYVAKFEGAKSFTFPALKDLGLDYTQTVKLYSTSVIVHGYPHTDVPLSGIIETNLKKGVLLCGKN